MTPPKKSRADAVLADALPTAQQAAADLAGADRVGAHSGFTLEGERLGTHRFECTDPGYRGWQWAVTLARVPRGRVATVCEVALLPGRDALLAPAWVPWAERLRPGDLGPADTLPFIAEDDRLVDQGERPDDDDDATPPRRRVLSPLGRAQAADRWYAGDHGPNAPAAKRAKANCGTCGFLIGLTGSTGAMFGVCANEWSADDGQVVSFDHGCGAHSETDETRERGEWQQNDPVIDETDIERLPGAATDNS